MEGDEGFLDMMNFGVSQQQPYSPVGEQEMPRTQESSASVKAKFMKGKNWSSAEDDMLVLAWLNTGLDAVIGNDQTSNSYWGRIYEYYNAHKQPFWSIRNQNALNCCWDTIQEQVNKFCRCYQTIVNRNQSGLTINERQAHALILYQSKDPKGRPFTLMHCWLELQKHAKWQTLLVSRGPQKKQKKTSDASPGTTSNDDEVEACAQNLETEIRPRGRKYEKERLRKGKGSASDGSGCKLSLETTWTQKLEKDEIKEAKKEAR